MRSLQETEEPTKVSDVRSFLGIAQYSSRFIEGFSSVTKPLRNLMKRFEMMHNDAKWTWEEAQKTAFYRVKTPLYASATLAYFDINKPIEIQFDASPVGIAALLSQENRPVCYASRALTD